MSSKNPILSLTKKPTLSLTKKPSLALVKKPPLTLKLVKKERNSPYLSIQNFVYRCLREKVSFSTRGLWEKYKMNEAHTTLIQEHHLEYADFKFIVETITQTYQPYEIQIRPFIQIEPTARINNDELIPKDI